MSDESRAAVPPVHPRDGHPEGASGRGRLEHPRPAASRPGLHARLRAGGTAPSSSTGATEIVAFLTRKWSREQDYRLIKELWAFDGNRIAVRFAYESHDDSGNWFRSYGNENWEFNENGLMRRRHASINDLPIAEADRKFHWPLGRRPDDHPGLSDLGL